MTVMRYFVRDEAPSQASHWVPPVDIYETEGHDVVLKAELPDMAREDIDVTVEHADADHQGHAQGAGGRAGRPVSPGRAPLRHVQPVVRAAEHGGQHQGERRLQERRPDGEAAVQGGSQAADDRRRSRRVSGRARDELRRGTACLPCYSDGLWRWQITELRPLETSLVRGGPGRARPKAPPIESRFLFVDVAAMRAKQLRRGALLRLDDDDESRRNRPFKCERLAMEEVKRGLVAYDVPKAARRTGAA